jgi:cell shape-determining protein MreC
MRKRLLIALASCLVFSVTIFLTRNSSPSLFIQGIFQSLYEAPKAILYEIAVKTNENSEVEHLRKENRLLRDRIADVSRLQADNVALKSQFENEKISSDSLLPAEVIGFQGGITNPDVLIINKGLDHGVSSGQAIIIDNNLIGITDTVGEKYSSILVVTNPRFKTVGKTDPDTILGVIQGTGDTILFDKISINDKLQIGQTILTRGTANQNGQGIPPNLVVGVVESVRRVESEPFQSAQVKILVDIAQLTRVFVMI